MKKREIELYVRQYPEIKRWLNQCVICQTIEYKPSLPVKIDEGFLAEHIREYFDVLEVNEINICTECNRHLSTT
jgi:hypothetical protein